MTEWIIKGIGAGKTTHAIQVASQKSAYIITSSFVEAKRIFKQAKEMGLKIPYPITVHEFKNGYKPGLKNVVIDDLTLILPLLFEGVNIEAITMTPPSNLYP